MTQLIPKILDVSLVLTFVIAMGIIPVGPLQLLWHRAFQSTFSRVWH